MPEKLTGDNTPSMRDLFDALSAGPLAGVKILKAELIDKHGWIVQVNSADEVSQSIGKKLILDGHTCDFQKYHRGGATVFVSAHVGGVTDLLLVQVQTISKGFPNQKFWLGYEEYRGAMGGYKVVVFDTNEIRTTPELRHFVLESFTRSSKKGQCLCRRLWLWTSSEEAYFY